MAQRTGGRTTAMVFLAMSLVAAIVATVVIYRVIGRYHSQLTELSQEEQKKPVVVATSVLQPGNTIKEDSLRIVQIPDAYVPDTAFVSVDEAVGRVPIERILEHEYVREERLADPKAGVGLNAIINQGMRALSINISDGQAVSGFLNPGNYVDILITVKDGEEEPKTITMLQAVKVLAVDDRMGIVTDPQTGRSAKQKKKGRPSVTLAVTPEQAERVIFGDKAGTLTLTLRNDVDVTEVQTHGTTASRLIGKESKPAVTFSTVQTRKTPDGSLMIIRGGRETTHQVGQDGGIR